MKRIGSNKRATSSARILFREVLLDLRAATSSDLRCVFQLGPNTPYLNLKLTRGWVGWGAGRSRHLRRSGSSERQARRVLVQPALGLRKSQKAQASQQSFGFSDEPEPVLRAVSITSNDAARRVGLDIFRNMRIPQESAIYRLFHGIEDYLSTLEDLGAWQSSDGSSLPARRVLVEARRFGADVYALVTPAH